MESMDQCRVKLVKDSQLGWHLTLEGDCTKELGIIEELKTGRQRYIKKRIKK